MALLSAFPAYSVKPRVSPVLESERGADTRVTGDVVVGVAVVVDVAEVRGIRPVSRRLPPVAAGTKPAKIQRITDKFLFLKLRNKLVICFSPAA